MRGYLARRGRGWGRESSRSQETSREGWGGAVHPEGVEVEPEAGLWLWGPTALSRPQGEAASAVWEGAERQARFLPPLFYLHVALLWQERGCGLTRMAGARNCGAAEEELLLSPVPAAVAWGMCRKNPAFPEPFQSSG